MNDHLEERRRTARIPVAARVRVKEGGREEVCFTEDLNEDGLFLRLENPPPVGAHMQMEISLPEVPELLKLKAEVVWRHAGRGCGVQFLRTTAKMKKLLQVFLRNVVSER